MGWLLCNWNPIQAKCGFPASRNHAPMSSYFLLLRGQWLEHQTWDRSVAHLGICFSLHLFCFSCQAYQVCLSSLKMNICSQHAKLSHFFFRRCFVDFAIKGNPVLNLFPFYLKSSRYWFILKLSLKGESPRRSVWELKNQLIINKLENERILEDSGEYFKSELDVIWKTANIRSQFERFKWFATKSSLIQRF